MAKGGGGTSGKVSYPSYMQDKHEVWLNNVNDLIQPYISAGAVSPYDGEAAYDPTTRIGEMNSSLSDLKTLIDNYDSESSWQSQVSEAKTKADSVFSFSDDTIDGIIDNAAEDSNSLFSDETTKALTDIEKFRSDYSSYALSMAESVADSVISKAGSTDLSEKIDLVVKTYEKSLKPQLFRSINRFAGGMVDINSVHSSAFVMGLANIENEFENDVRKFSAEQWASLRSELATQLYSTYLKLFDLFVGSNLRIVEGRMEAVKSILDTHFRYFSQEEGNKANLILNGANTMSNILLQEKLLNYQYTSLSVDTKRMELVAEKEQADKDIELSVQDAKWPFDVLLLGGNVLASISGAAYTVDHPISTAQSALSGALTGASAGATLASATGIGTPVGALVGAAIGAGMAFF